MKIKISDYDQKWADTYQQEALNIKTILQHELIQSFHIGSTAVPGLKAKPIIDILLVVQDVHKLDLFAKAFEALGYEVMGEFGLTGRRYFRKGGDNRSHQIHAFQYDNLAEIERHLIFRDYLRCHPEVCQQYGILKSTLAIQNPDDIIAYGDGKENFVNEIERKAIQWHWSIR